MICWGKMHEEEQKYVQEAFETNWVSTVGANLNELEKGISEKVGCDVVQVIGTRIVFFRRNEKKGAYDFCLK